LGEIINSKQRVLVIQGVKIDQSQVDELAREHDTHEEEMMIRLLF
jgi:hypothetical protein